VNESLSASWIFKSPFESFRTSRDKTLDAARMLTAAGM